MIKVSDVYEDAKEIVGICDQQKIFTAITDAVEMLANKGDFDPLMGFVDVCVGDGNCVTLPREIETILAINIGRHPSIIRDRLFSFHLNGPGDDCGCSCGYSVQDLGDVVTFRELEVPSKLVAFVELAEDANKEIWVFGYDVNGKWIRTEHDGATVDGYLVPTIFGYSVPAGAAPYFSRIIRVEKAEFVGPVRLASFDVSATTGTVIGNYEWDETLPIYRRIKINRSADWVRIQFRRRTFKVKSTSDFLPLHNRLAIVMAFRAIKHWNDDKPDLALMYEANAARMLTEEQFTRTPPTSSPMQVNPRSTLQDKSDCVD